MLSCLSRHLAVATIATGLTALTTALATPAAEAAPGTYMVQSCMDAGFENELPVVDNFGGWFGEASRPDSSHKFYNDCGGSLGLFMQLKGTDRKAAGDFAGWKAIAPAGTLIADAVLTWDAYTRPFNGSTQGLFAIRAPAGGSARLVERAGGSSPDHYSVLRDLNATSLSAMVYCESVVGTADCPAGEDATALIRRAILTYADPLPPRADYVEGSALEAGIWSGTENLLAEAFDAGSGIAEFRWYVDGEVVLRTTPDSNGGACVPDGVEGDVPMYHAPKPCPSSATVVEDLDTTGVEDGPHQMELVVADASGRETSIVSGIRTVANHPPVNAAAPAFADAARASAPHVGEDLTASRGSWTGPDLTYAVAWERCEADGSGCVLVPGATAETYAPTAADLGKRLRMAVTATNPAASVTARTALTAPVSAAPTAGPGGGTGGTGGTAGTGGGTTGGTGGTTGGTGTGTTGNEAPGLPGAPGTTPPAADPGHVLQGRVAGEPPTATCPQDRATLVLQGVAGRSVKLRYGRSGQAAVVLTCTATGKAIANARLDVATRTGSRPAVASQITTDGDGRAVLRLPRGASRAITVGYRMYADDPLARATVTLRVEVRGRVKLRANRRVLRNGQAVRLSGTLAGGRVPRRGVDLAVQWRDGRRWRPFAQVRTDRRGRFHYAYRFTRTRGSIRYALRVQVVKGQVDYPYVPAASNAVRLVVRG